MFSYHKWLEQSLATRVTLAEIFGVPKTGATEVSSNVVVKDGYHIKDLEEKITPETMASYLEPADYGEDDNLFDLVIEKATYVPPAPVVAQEVVVKTTVVETVTRPVTLTNQAGEEVPAGSDIIETEKEPHAETKKSSKK